MKISDLLFYFNEWLSFWQLFPFKFFKKKKEKEFGITNNFDIFQQAPYRPAVEVTSMSYLPNTQIECYLGNINLFLIRESHTVREVKTKLGCYFNVPIFVSILWSYGEYKSNLQSNKHYLSKVKIRLEKKFRPVLVIMMVPNKLIAQVLFITAKIALYSLPYPQFTQLYDFHIFTVSYDLIINCKF